MHERMLDLATPDGAMDMFVTHPEEGGPFPAVVVFMDIWGLREELFDIARRIATVGYYCLVPNFYHREGKICFERRNAAGRLISFDRVDDETRRRMEESFKPLSNAMVMSDIGALIESLHADPAARAGAMGSVGYCMGGRHVLCAAGQFPQSFVASASLHGTALISEREDLPHRLVDRFRGEVYCGYGEIDPYTPPGLVAEMEQLLRASDVGFQLPRSQGRRSRLCAAGSRHLRQAGRQPRLGAHLRDVPPPARARTALTDDTDWQRDDCA